MEYTLEDAFETLRDKKIEQEKKKEDLIGKTLNNKVFTLKSSSSLEDVKMKKKRLCQRSLKEIKSIEPEDYPILGTSDLRVEVMTEMEEKIRNIQKPCNSLKRKLPVIQEDIYLKNKKDRLAKIKEAYMDKETENETHEKEFVAIKHIFQQVKKDLDTVIDIFLGDKDFKELFAALIIAYIKDEEDKYINITPTNYLYVFFLIQNEIVQYHPSDNTKVKLTDK